MRKDKTIHTNKEAFFSYDILDRHTAGIVLQGAEIKAIRMGKANIKGTYGYFQHGDLWLQGMHIGRGNATPHNTRQPKKLLLHREAIRRLRRKKKERSLTIIALRLFITSKGWAKVDIALARGKKLYDKRNAIKERALRRRTANPLQQ